MQNAGLQYGQGVTPIQESPFGGTNAQGAASNSTSTLRQFRKKDNVDKITSSLGGLSSANTGTENTNSSHVARVAPHNHYPHKQNEYFRFPPQYQEYGSPYKEHTVKYSEIAETVPQSIPHLDHLPPSVLSKHKEKDYAEMCNIPQQTHINKSYPDHQFNGQQAYPPEMTLHHQYMHKETQNQMHSPYKPESQYIPKDGGYNHQMPPFLKYNIPQSRNYGPLDNSSLGHFQRMDQHIARSLMTEHPHMREYSADYSPMEQGRIYSQKQRYYPTPLPPTNSSYPPNYPRNIPAQQYNYPSCNYPRSSQVNRYPINMERSMSPRRTYSEGIDMGMNYATVPQKMTGGYPNYPTYAQHYQHRRLPSSVPQEYYHPQQNPHPRPHPQYMPTHHSQEVTENHVASNNIRQYLENWAEEEPTTDIPTQIDPKYISRINRDDGNEVYVINASELPQYLENGVPLVTSENGQYIFKSNVSIDNTGAIKIIDKTADNNMVPTDTQERVVSLHIIENPKTDCLINSSIPNINEHTSINPSAATINVITSNNNQINDNNHYNNVFNTDRMNLINQVPPITQNSSHQTQNFSQTKTQQQQQQQCIKETEIIPSTTHLNNTQPIQTINDEVTSVKNCLKIEVLAYSGEVPQNSCIVMPSTQNRLNFDESLLPNPVPCDSKESKSEDNSIISNILNDDVHEELDKIVEDTLTSTNIPLDSCDRGQLTKFEEKDTHHNVTTNSEIPDDLNLDLESNPKDINNVDDYSMVDIKLDEEIMDLSTSRRGSNNDNVEQAIQSMELDLSIQKDDKQNQIKELLNEDSSSSGSDTHKHMKHMPIIDDHFELTCDTSEIMETNVEKSSSNDDITTKVDGEVEKPQNNDLLDEDLDTNKNLDKNEDDETKETEELKKTDDEIEENETKIEDESRKIEEVDTTLEEKLCELVGESVNTEIVKSSQESQVDSKIINKSLDLQPLETVENYEKDPPNELEMKMEVDTPKQNEKNEKIIIISNKEITQLFEEKENEVTSKPEEVTKIDEVFTKSEGITFKPEEVASKEITFKPHEVPFKPEEVTFKPEEVTSKLEEVAPKSEEKTNNIPIIKDEHVVNTIKIDKPIEKRKEGGRKRRIFSVDDIINRIGSSLPIKRRESIQFPPEINEEVTPKPISNVELTIKTPNAEDKTDQKDVTHSYSIETSASTSNDIEEKKSNDLILPSHHQSFIDITPSIDRTSDFQSIIEKTKMKDESNEIVNEELHSSNKKLELDDFETPTVIKDEEYNKNVHIDAEVVTNLDEEVLPLTKEELPLTKEIVPVSKEEPSIDSLPLIDEKKIEEKPNRTDTETQTENEELTKLPPCGRFSVIHKAEDIHKSTETNTEENKKDEKNSKNEETCSTKSYCSVIQSTDDKIRTEKSDCIMRTEKIDDIITEQTDDIITEKTDDLITEKTDDIITEKIDDIITEKPDDIIRSEETEKKLIQNDKLDKKPSLKKELTFEERFVEPLSNCENEENSITEDFNEKFDTSDEIQYRSIIKIEENNVLIEIGGELVELCVNQVNGKKVITVTPMSNTATVDFNDNYEHVDRTQIFDDITEESSMPVLHEETINSPNRTDTNKESTPPPPILIKMINSTEDEENLDEISDISSTQIVTDNEDIFQDVILNENEIIIGDECLEEEINLDIQTNDEIKEKPIISTKAAKKLYDDTSLTIKLPTKTTFNSLREFRRIKNEPNISIKNENKEVIKVKKGVRGNLKQKKTSKRISTRHKTITERKEESKSALRELIERRKMRKEKIRLKYTQYAKTERILAKKPVNKKTKKINEKIINQETVKQSNPVKIEKVQKNINDSTKKTSKKKNKEKHEEHQSENNINSIKEQEIDNTKTEESTVIVSSSITIESTPKNFHEARPSNPTPIMKNINIQEKHQKFPKISTPRDLSLTKNVNEHYLSRKDHSNLKKKLSIQEYNSRKRKPQDKNYEQEQSSNKKIPTDIETVKNISERRPSTIYSEKQMEYVPNGVKDPRRRPQTGFNIPPKLNEDVIPQTSNVSSSKMLRINETTQSIPSVIIKNTLLNLKDSYTKQLQNYKNYKAFLLGKASVENSLPKPLQTTNRRKSIDITNQLEKRKVSFDDVVQINEINTTESKIINVKNDALNYCEVSSSSSDPVIDAAINTNEDTKKTSRKYDITQNDWENSNSPKETTTTSITDAFAENFLDKTQKDKNIKQINKNKLIIDINDFDTSLINNELKIPYKNIIDSSNSQINHDNDGNLKNYKDEVDSKLNSLNIKIPKIKTKNLTEDDILMHKFLRKEQLNSEEIKQIRGIIYLKKKLQQLTTQSNNTNTITKNIDNENYEIKKNIDNTNIITINNNNINNNNSNNSNNKDLKLQFKKIDGRIKKKKKRFRNLYSDSPETSESEFQETAGEFSVYEGKNLTGVKLIFKRKTDLVDLQPIVKLQRCRHIESMAKKIKTE